MRTVGTQTDEKPRAFVELAHDSFFRTGEFARGGRFRLIFETTTATQGYVGYEFVRHIDHNGECGFVKIQSKEPKGRPPPKRSRCVHFSQKEPEIYLFDADSVSEEMDIPLSETSLLTKLRNWIRRKI